MNRLVQYDSDSDSGDDQTIGGSSTPHASAMGSVMLHAPSRVAAKTAVTTTSSPAARKVVTLVPKQQQQQSKKNSSATTTTTSTPNKPIQTLPRATTKPKRTHDEIITNKCNNKNSVLTEEYQSEDDDEEENHDRDTHSPAASTATAQKKRRELPSSTTPITTPGGAVKLPPPDFLTAAATRTDDASSSAAATAPPGKRKRQVPHIEGNWPTYIYIPVASINDSMRRYIASEQNLFLEHLKRLEKCGDPCGGEPRIMNTIEETKFHVSLSRTLYLQFHHIDPLVDLLQKELSQYPKFTITFLGSELYLNDDKSTTFLGINVNNGFDQICSMVRTVDRVIAKFSQPPFHKEPKPHVSVAWASGDNTGSAGGENDITSSSTTTTTTASTSTSSMLLLMFPHDFELAVSHVEIKSGNRIFRIHLLG